MDTATPVVAVSAALGLYLYWKGRSATNAALTEGGLSPPVQVEAWRNDDVSHPPSSWADTLRYLKEAFRYVYTESLGRWHTMDLFIGLAYLSHREALDYPAQDIALRGRPISKTPGDAAARSLLIELREVQRYLLYCRGLKYKKSSQQIAFWNEHLQLDPSRVLAQQAHALLLRPAYVLIADNHMRCVVLCIRGTQSTKDLFTSLAATTKPHHKVQASGVVLGYSHMGMLAAARWLMKQVAPQVREAMEQNQGYRLCLVGHSMGAGTAALLTTMIRESVPGCADARCYALACPACMTMELAESCKEYVTSVINGTDIVPTFSGATVDSLREDVRGSSWFVEFQRDLRSSVFRALQGGLRGVGTATQWTARNILQPAVVPFRSCYNLGGGLGPAVSTLVSATDSLEALGEELAATHSHRSPAPASSSDTAPLGHWRASGRRGSGGGVMQPAAASPHGGTVSTQMLRRRLWPWGSSGGGGSSAGADQPVTSIGYDAAASVSFAGWMPDGASYVETRQTRSANPSKLSEPSSGGLFHRKPVSVTASKADTPPFSETSSVVFPITSEVASSLQMQPATPVVTSSRWWWPAREVLERSTIAGGRISTSRSGRTDIISGEPALPTSSNAPGSPLLPARDSASEVSSPEGFSGNKPVAPSLGAGWGWGLFFQTCTAKREHGTGSSGPPPDPRSDHRNAPLLEKLLNKTSKGEEDDIKDDEAEVGDHAGREYSMDGGGPSEAVVIADAPLMEQHLQEGIAAVVEAMTHSELSLLGEDDGGGEEDISDDEEEVGDKERDLYLDPEASYHDDVVLQSPDKLQRVRVEGPTEDPALIEVAAVKGSLDVGGIPLLEVQSTSQASPSSPIAHLRASQIPPPATIAASKRHLYPAGRILHLFPQSALSVGTPDSATTADHTDGSGAPSTLDVLSEQHLSQYYPVPQGLRPTPSDVTSARMTAAQGPHVLLEVRDCRAYARIKLCRTMVLDHLTPSYFTALDSVIRRLEEGLVLRQDSDGEVVGISNPRAASAHESEGNRDHISAKETKAAGHRRVSLSSGADVLGIRSAASAAVMRQRAFGKGVLVGPDGDLI